MRSWAQSEICVIDGMTDGLGELDPDHRELYYTVGIISGAGNAIRNNHLYEERR